MRQVDKYKSFVNVKTEPDSQSDQSISGLGFSKITNNQQMDYEQRGLTEIKMLNKLK